MLVHFIGGPRAGTSKEYPCDPKVLGCIDEVKANKIPPGTYRTTSKAGDSVTMTWKEIK